MPSPQKIKPKNADVTLPFSQDQFIFKSFDSKSEEGKTKYA
jgi:hypothetical protein